METTRTEFGKANSVFRHDRNLKLRQVAEYLNVSPAFLSSVEVGRKPIPEEWFAKLIKLYRLDPLQSGLLRKAGLKSQKRFVIEIQNEKEAELLAAFVENRDKLDDHQLELAICDLTIAGSGVQDSEELETTD